MSDYFELYDYRMRVAEIYRERNQALRDGAEPSATAERFREQRDDLFRNHSQSALDEEQKRVFQGINYFPYNPAAVFEVTVEEQQEVRRQSVTMNAEEQMEMSTIGRLNFEVEGSPVSLSLYWLEIYGGGLFLPFRDATSPAESYGGGRYLFDTIKGSNFLEVGSSNGQSLTGRKIVLDFNYAYNPSCAYNSRWVCPLAPVENRISVALRAGEMNFAYSK
ncbi:MAG TPA: DUF1684 domain-containing protein [Ktedonobacteraceae bacterium]|nr:DUF1684 domain-containing protein [Ktedonobacteraceae bacterium]